MGDSVAARLSQGCKLLALIDRRRAEAGDDHIGAAVERRILDRELRELEQLEGTDEMAIRVDARRRRSANVKRRY